MSLLGGVASPIGSAIGTGLLILIPEWLRFLKSVPGLYLAIYGLSVILIIRYMPDGIWGFVTDRDRRAGAATPRRTPPVGAVATGASDASAATSCWQSTACRSISAASRRSTASTSRSGAAAFTR